MYIESMVSPIDSVMIGCCEPCGNWLSTALTRVLISVTALFGS
jgi:hypothetical protein